MIVDFQHHYTPRELFEADDHVPDFVSPDAAGKAVMFLIAVGHPARQTRMSG